MNTKQNLVLSFLWSQKKISFWRKGPKYNTINKKTALFRYLTPWRQEVPPKRRCISTRIHDVTTEDTEFHFHRPQNLQFYSHNICPIFLAHRPPLIMASSFTRFLNHTQRRTTVGRTPQGEWSARRRAIMFVTFIDYVTLRMKALRFVETPGFVYPTTPLSILDDLNLNP